MDDLVTVPQFLNKATPLWRELGRLPRCPGCGAVVHPYGAHAAHGIKRFDHPDLPPSGDDLDDCLLARRGPRFSIFDGAELHAAAGADLRRRFFEDGNLKLAYSFCLQACGRGNLSVRAFRRLVARADRRRVWSLAGAQLWAMPFVLLSLDNFEQTAGPDFHFVLSRGRRRAAVPPWQGVSSAVLRKVRSEDGAGYGGRFAQLDVSERELISIAGDVSWMGSGMTHALGRARFGADRRNAPSGP